MTTFLNVKLHNKDTIGFAWIRVGSNRRSPRVHPGGIGRPGEFDHPDHEARVVEITDPVDVGHLGAFTADHGAPGNLATDGDDDDDVRGVRRITKTPSPAGAGEGVSWIEAA